MAHQKITLLKSPRATVWAYARLTRFDRPIGALLLLWPTLWALWLAAGGVPELRVLAIFIAGTFVMRAAGCVVNDYADRHIDPHIARTRHRPLATGELSPRQAGYAFALLLIAGAGLVLQLNFFTQILAVFALAIATLYPFAKRVTHLPQLVLGVAFSWGIPMAYAAVGDALPREAWLLFAANLAWIVAYDTQYAMADRAEDLAVGVKSSAILFAQYDNFIIGMLHLVCVGLLAWLGVTRGFAAPFYLGLSAALGLAIWQQILCRQRDPAGCLRAFHNNNWFGAAIFAGIAWEI